MKFLMIILLGVGLSGCAGTLNDLQNINRSIHDLKQGGEQGKTNRAKQSYDTHMSKKMYLELDEEMKRKYVISVWNNALTFRHKYFSQSNKDPMLDRGPYQEIIANYSNYDSTQDELAERFYAAVAERGGKVGLFQPQINAELSKLFKDNSPQRTHRYYNDWDLAIIEFSKTGRMQSALIRNHYVSTTTTTKFHDMYSYVLLGPLMRDFEKKISLDSLNKYKVSEFTPTL
ncbi:MAG: hypothetical protein MI867_06515 [Pseudomonadales bacterium]|nr:hypothetical protein [Pseudomonadales bacterium]